MQSVVLSLLIVACWSASTTIKLEVFIESMCPDTARFIGNSLKQLALPDIDQVLEIELIPFGKATAQLNNNGGVDFTCQHGVKECYGNMMQSCGLKYLESTKDKITFIACMESEVHQQMDNFLEKCTEEQSGLYESVMACLNGPEGVELLYQNSIKTPKLSYVPNFRVNGKMVADTTPFEKNLLAWACHQNPVIAELLIVNAYPPTSQGLKRFLDFRFLVQKFFIECSAGNQNDNEYIVRDPQSVVDFIYEIQSGYVNQSAVTVQYYCYQGFANFDMVIVAGCGTLLPWSPQMERVLVLLRMCIRVQKYCFACGSGMLALAFISASGYDRTVQFTKDGLNPLKCFVERSTGDIYAYHADSKQWQPKANAGLHNAKSAQEFQTLGKYVLKAPVYRPTKIYTSKNNELVVYVKATYVQHYAFSGLEKSQFLTISHSKWDVHSFSFPSAERAFTVLAESDRGPVVIEYGSYILGTFFEIHSTYPSTLTILKNYISITMEKIHHGTRIDKGSVFVPSRKFKISRHLNIELLYRSAPSSPKENNAFKHSGFAAKKSIQQYSKRNHISDKTYQLQSTRRSEHKPNVSVAVPQSEVIIQESRQLSRQEIRQMLHPSLEIKCDKLWIPGSMSKSRSSNSNHQISNY